MANESSRLSSHHDFALLLLYYIIYNILFNYYLLYLKPLSRFPRRFQGLFVVFVCLFLITWIFPFLSAPFKFFKVLFFFGIVSLDNEFQSLDSTIVSSK